MDVSSTFRQTNNTFGDAQQLVLTSMMVVLQWVHNTSNIN